MAKTVRYLVANLKALEQPNLEGQTADLVVVLALNNSRGNDIDWYQILVNIYEKKSNGKYYSGLLSANSWWSLGYITRDGLAVDGNYPTQNGWLSESCFAILPTARDGTFGRPQVLGSNGQIFGAQKEMIQQRLDNVVRNGIMEGCKC